MANLDKLPGNFTGNLRIVHKSEVSNHTTSSALERRIGIGLIMFFVLLILIILNASTEDTSIPSNLPESDVNWDDPPCSPNELSSEWKEVTPEMMKKNSQRSEFEFVGSGFKIAFDEGVPGQPQFRGKNHWHLYNPNSTGASDYYLDKNGKPIHKNDKNSHIEAKCK